MLKSYNEFLLEKEGSDLFKIYLAYNPDYGHRFWTYKDYSTDKFFIKLTPENYKDIKINKDFPVLNYNNDFTNTLLDEGLIKKENVYNLPEYVEDSGSKTKFHKKMEGTGLVPATCHSKEEEIKEVGFPMICKPSQGHSGKGIIIVKDQDGFDKLDHSEVDLYSEYIDKSEAHRFFNFKGEAFFWQERTPTNDKAKTGEGGDKDTMMFDYKKRKIEGLDDSYKEVIAKVSEIFKDLPFLCLDLMKDQSGKVYVIETNAMPGVPFDSTVDIYKKLFSDFYGHQVNPESNNILKACSNIMNSKTIKGYRDYDKGRFSIED